MANFEVKVDLDVYVECLLCANICSKTNFEEDLMGYEASLKMLLRYLNIDYNSELVSEGVTFCDKCGPAMAEFLEWYRNLEAVRLCLGQCIFVVFEILKKRDNLKGDLSMLTDGQFNLTGLDILRRKIIYKCQDKLVSKPQVKLDKVNIQQISTPVLKTDIHERNLSSIKKPEKEKPTCEFCPMTFYQKDNVNRHSMQRHTFLHFSSELPPSTTQAQLETAIKVIMGKNLDCNNPSGPGCHKCNKVLQNQSKLRLHVITTHWSEVKQFLQNGKIYSRSKPIPQSTFHFCGICKKTFKTRRALSIHKNSHRMHPQIKNKLKKTPKSNSIVEMEPQISSAIIPMEGHIVEGKPNCKICLKTYSCFQTAHRHSKYYHTYLHFSEKLPPSTTPLQLEEAIGTVMEVIVDKNSLTNVPICFPCKKQFSCQSYFRRHTVATHWTEVINTLQGQDKASLLIAMRPPQSNLHECVSCRKSFKTRAALCIHKKYHKAHRPKMKKTAKSKLTKLIPATCKFCSKTFSDKRNAKRHSLDIHTFPHFYEKLPLGTTQPQFEEAIRNIMKTIMDNKSFPKCTPCRKVFPSQGYVRFHSLTTHWNDVVDLLQGIGGDIHGHKDILPLKLSNTRKTKTSRTRGGGRHKCKFCSQTFTSEPSAYRHSINCHTFLHFSDVLPPGTSQAQFEKAIGIVSKKNLDELLLHCLKCRKTFGAKSLVRNHIALLHWTEIEEWLREEGAKQIQNEETPIDLHEIGDQILSAASNEFLQFSFPNSSRNVLSSGILPIICNTVSPVSVVPSNEDANEEAMTSIEVTGSTYLNSKAEPEELHICPYCSRAFKLENRLTHHLTTIHTMEQFEKVLVTNLQVKIENPEEVGQPEICLL